MNGIDKPIGPDLKVLFICPSLVGAGVERRVCSLIDAIQESRYRILLGLLRNEGDLLDDVSEEKRVSAALPKITRLSKLPSGLQAFFNAILAIHQQRELLRTVRPSIVVTFTLETILPMAFCLGILKKKILFG